MLEFGAHRQERILEVPSVHKGGFIKAWGRDPWTERVVMDAPGL